MNRFLILLPTLLFSLALTAQVTEKNKVILSKKLTTVNRTSRINGDTLKLDEKPGVGIVWFDAFRFSEGTIEFDVQGKDVLQQSFVGIAFHGQHDSIYDAVYFRPFNFKAADAVRKSHAVQYISMPGNDWPTLREKHPGQYEQPVSPTPDPNGWFHVKVVVKGNNIKVYVENSATPCLNVNKLNTRKEGLAGVWAGNSSGGAWRNLVISKTP